MRLWPLTTTTIPFYHTQKNVEPVLNKYRSENAFYMYVSHLLRFPLGLSALSRTLAKIYNIFECTKKMTGKLKIFVITRLVESDKVESLECRV
jgi:hypothetical protein